LHTGSGRCVGVRQTAIDHIEATLPLVQSQLKIGSATSWIVLVAPLDIEDPVGSSATDRSKDAKPGVYRVQVAPIRNDCVVVRDPRQRARVNPVVIGGRELGIAVGRQVH
jgi:hypothetical protein